MRTYFPDKHREKKVKKWTLLALICAGWDDAAGTVQQGDGRFIFIVVIILVFHIFFSL